MITTKPVALSSGEQFVRDYRTRVDAQLKIRLDANRNADERLGAAMLYSLMNGGKRIRALLVYASALAVGDIDPLTDASAVALETIHAYSLVHDDLPAMDDDDLRRNQPTCHIAFDEATAILAGDTLQTLAFEWLSDPTLSENKARQIELLHTMACASGDKGMGAGQAIDLAAVDSEPNLEKLTLMHQLKTGKLIAASIEMGARSTGLTNTQQLSALARYAEAIGLAFQIQDDILDVIADTETLGKPQGADVAQNKPTFVSLLGLEAAQQYASEQHKRALGAISSFDHYADNLRYIANYIVKRPY
ncbi:MAG: geranylgeranyl pyrophosphate synthase [Cellvibrionaceae bacterium]|jgi:geranylgeranyl pyrophosphate synthase